MKFVVVVVVVIMLYHQMPFHTLRLHIYIYTYYDAMLIHRHIIYRYPLFLFIVIENIILIFHTLSLSLSLFRHVIISSHSICIILIDVMNKYRFCHVEIRPVDLLEIPPNHQ